MLLAVGAVYVAVNLLKNGWTAIIVALNVFFITFNLIGVRNIANIKQKYTWFKLFELCIKSVCICLIFL